MTKDKALKHHAEKYGVSLEQFKIMCNNASKHYENQGMNSVDYGLAREAYFAGFTDACKEALDTKQVCENVSPAQEPVGFVVGSENYPCINVGYASITDNTLAVGTPLYTHPHQDGTSPLKWTALTDDEIDKIYAETEPDSKMDTYYMVLSRAIEQALKEKNHG